MDKTELSKIAMEELPTNSVITVLEAKGGFRVKATLEHKEGGRVWWKGFSEFVAADATDNQVRMAFRELRGVLAGYLGQRIID